LSIGGVSRGSAGAEGMTAAISPDFVLPSTEDLAALIEQVWSSFVGEELSLVELKDASDVSEFSARDRVLSSVSITGPWCGHLTISVTSEGAGEIAASMFQIPADEMDEAEIADAFGEVANVAGGNVKAMLPEPSTLSLPQVIVEARWISLYSARLCGTAVMQWRDFLMDVSLWETSSFVDPNPAQETEAA
jgi:chemotaxis protein CheX